jgi:spore coat protein CotH
MTRTGTPGPALSPKDVSNYPTSVPFYDANTLRTLFLEFDRPDWEQELAAFYHTDVLVPATLTVDGKAYRDVGVSFRGNNSFTAVPEGLKRPLSIALDAWRDQDLLGYRSLNLLNSNQDPTMLRSVLFLEVARDYIPAVKANFARVVINGESWGVYVNQQTFSKEFERETFKTNKGTRWKSPNNSVGGGLSYLGDDVALYRRWYEMKGADNLAAWNALIHVTKVLNQTPLDQLERALAPLMDVDEVLRYLALDIALVNGDGYWRDGSDFNLYLSEKGRFLVTLHDVNEGFRTGGRAGDAAQPDPLTALDDPNKALRQKLLVVPALRTKYLAYVGDIAEKWLDWTRLGPIVERHQTLIADDMARDGRKLDTIEAFMTGIYGPGDGTPPSASTIKGFADQRRAALLAHPEILKARR